MCGIAGYLLRTPRGEEDAPRNSIVLLSHVPMLLGTFSIAQREEFAALVEPVRDQVFGNLAGHLHVDIFDEDLDAGYVTWVTDATWDDEVRVRAVEVWFDGQTDSYVQELVNVPF